MANAVSDGALDRGTASAAVVIGQALRMERQGSRSVGGAGGACNDACSSSLRGGCAAQLKSWCMLGIYYIGASVLALVCGSSLAAASVQAACSVVRRIAAAQPSWTTTRHLAQCPVPTTKANSGAPLPSRLSESCIPARVIRPSAADSGPSLQTSAHPCCCPYSALYAGLLCVMAANDYYSSFPGGNNPASRPPPPQHTASAQSLQSISPVTSPFDDASRYDNHHPDYSSTAHLAHTQTGLSSAYSDTAYHGNDQSHPYNNRYDSPPAAAQHDPFADQNAIPLQQQGKMGTHPAATGVYQMDPEGRPREKRRKKKKGWLSGRVTWVVYILTTIQLGVFIGEIIKNGMYNIPSSLQEQARECSRAVNGKTAS